jgi:hypothetical protein
MIIRRTCAALVAVLLVAMGGTAFAGNIKNEVGAFGSNRLSLAGGTGQSTMDYYVQKTGACDVTPSSVGRYRVNISGTGVTASPAELAFAECEVRLTVTFTATTAGIGAHAVTLSRVSGPTIATSPSDFTLTVVAPSNTAPSVVVGGVTAGASYEYGAVPTPVCNVSDAEDSNEAATPVLSGIAGPLSAHGLGQRTATCTYTDAGGLSATASATYQIVDTVKPVLDTPGDQVLEATGPNGAAASWTVTGSDNVALKAPASCSPASGSTFDLGTHTVACSATDVAGNTTTGRFAVTVQDTRQPTLVVDNDVTVEATGPDGAIATYASPTATDTHDLDLAPECLPASGSLFAVGDTPVSCSVSDDSGNSSTGGLTVHVVDTAGPVIDLPEDRTVEATSPGGAHPTFTASATDVVEGSRPVSCLPDSGSLFPFDDTLVTCSSTDSRGNASSASFTVTVVDTAAPDLQVPGSLIREATSALGAEVGYADRVAATDVADDDPLVTCIPASGSTFALGTTTVNCTAVDQHGNSVERSFPVTVEDTTGPVITAPAGVTEEATGPDGATVTFVATGLDAVDGAREVSCTPTSGSTFALGTVTVTCTSADSRGNSSQESFDVRVADTTAPDLSIPADVVAEATGRDGAEVGFATAATDLVDGEIVPVCTPAAHTVFALGAHEVACTATDAAGNVATGTFRVTVRDTTGPVIAAPESVTEEATGPGGATVTYVATAEDLVDGPVDATCTPASGWLFDLGLTTVTCTATDARGNQTSSMFDVSVRDTTAPGVSVPSTIVREATGPGGAVATWTASATDIVDGAVTPVCTPPSGSLFGLGSTRVTCSATDAHENEGRAGFDVVVRDTTGPELRLPANATAMATSAAGAPITWTASATDIVAGSRPVTCMPASGSLFAPGTTTVSCSASDGNGNTTTGSFTVTVTFGWNGFFAPVDNNGVYNVIKAGQSVPLKWNVPNGSGGWISSLSDVRSDTQSKVTCQTAAPTDEIEAPTSGATELRYDTTANQFIYNWQSPKVGAGTCYRLGVTLTDGSSRTALFRTK